MKLQLRLLIGLVAISSAAGLRTMATRGGVAWAPVSGATAVAAAAAARTPSHVRMMTPPLAPLPPLASSACVFGAFNLLGLTISTASPKTQYHLDLLGTGAFAAAAYFVHGTTLPSLISAGAVGLWATKLASFLFYRVLMVKTDARLEATLSTASGRLGFWLISFLWGWIVSLPHTLAAGVQAAELEAAATTTTAAATAAGSLAPVQLGGILAFLIGLWLETAADFQKWAFKADPANQGAFCDVGVWRLSQHPNWAGNLLIWSGIFLVNAPALLSGIGSTSAVSLLGGTFVAPAWFGAACRFGVAAASPLFLFALFSGQANGVPPLEKGYEMTLARFGADAAFQEYAASTPRLLPTLQSITAWATRGGRA